MLELSAPRRPPSRPARRSEGRSRHFPHAVPYTLRLRVSRKGTNLTMIGSLIATVLSARTQCRRALSLTDGQAEQPEFLRHLELVSRAADADAARRRRPAPPDAGDRSLRSRRTGDCEHRRAQFRPTNADTERSTSSCGSESQERRPSAGRQEQTRARCGQARRDDHHTTRRGPPLAANSKCSPSIPRHHPIRGPPCRGDESRHRRQSRVISESSRPLSWTRRVSDIVPYQAP